MVNWDACMCFLTSRTGVHLACQLGQVGKAGYWFDLKGMQNAGFGWWPNIFQRQFYIMAFISIRLSNVTTFVKEVFWLDV